MTKIIEHLSDPIMHLIRNAIDHGIETPEERKEKGKAAEGYRLKQEMKVVMSGYVRDDGRKDRTKLLKPERGIISDGVNIPTARYIPCCFYRDFQQRIMFPNSQAGESVWML